METSQAKKGMRGSREETGKYDQMQEFIQLNNFNKLDNP